MRRCSQFEPLKIVDVIEEEYSCELHAQDHFEVIYIHYGSGVHFFNEITVPYEKGDLFLLAPGARHYFTVHITTRFTYIKFTPGYFEFHSPSVRNASHEITPTAIMQIQWLKQDKISVKEPCQTILKNTFENIILYNSTIDVARSSIIHYQILSIFGMIKEYLEARSIEVKKQTPTNAHIAAYIQENIYNRELIGIKSIAEHFNISPAYFSTYFKRNFGTTYREYLEKLLLQLIKQRLRTKEIKLKQIADEFGFTDVSHLSKFFKKHEGINPSEFK
ncbi:AraC family transcriptional regulator [Dysgonomonas sp. 521]|uniref:AraC family transcriptional regulator n=1 Tax=Dysgonomonas sp. 521 TaxID=2302932 RepID=UPI0013D731AC|nr:AraC family transcriptional regulator [Dysgonomonas sp. 521]NDV96611.1 AraC family transcriptional regulator [Dysgonomonas sp. 521]